MGDVPVKHPSPLHQKITLSCKTLDFYLKLLLLLENMKHSEGVMQRCPIAAKVCRFPNFTSEAGSPFFFKLPIPATLGHGLHYQLSLADGHRALPNWMMFTQQTRSLAGLALTEDCGIYHLKVSVAGVHHAAYFYLHIINRTMTGKDSARDALPCSEGGMTTWASLLLHLNPVTLDAGQRIRLVNTLAEYLHLPPGFVHLFSRIKSFIQQQEDLRVCGQGGLTEKITGGNAKKDASADVARLLWRVGCQMEEQQSDLAKVLEYSVTTGGLARLLEATVLGWRMFCASGVVRRRVKRDFQRLKLTPTSNMIIPPPPQIHQTAKFSHIFSQHSHVYSSPFGRLEPSLMTVLFHMSLEPTLPDKKGFLPQSSDRQANTCPYSLAKVFMFTSRGKTNLHDMQVLSFSPFSIEHTPLHPTLFTPISVELGCSPPYLFSVSSYRQRMEQTGPSALKIKPHAEARGCSEQVSEVTSHASISEHFWTTELFHAPFSSEHISVVRTSLGEPTADTVLSLFPSSTPHGIYPSLLLTPVSCSATSTLTHEAVDRKSLATRLTPRPLPKETPLWTGAYRVSHTDSESQPTVSSLGHFTYNQGPFKDHHTAKPTLHTLTSVSHLPLTENYNDVLLQNSRLKTIQSLPPSNKIPSTQLFPDVSPTSYLMTKQLSITQQQSDTIQHLSLVLNQDVMSQLSVTTQDVSSTTLMGQLTLSGPIELESSLPTSLLEPPMTTLTPALPSELGFFSRQLETPSIMNPVFTVESLKATSSVMPPLETLSVSSPDIVVSSLQNNLESSVLKSELCFNQNALMQTLSSDILLMSLQLTNPSRALQTSLPVTKTHHIISVPLSVFKDQPFEEQPSIKTAHESLRFMPSLQQTPHTMLHGASQQIFSHILVTGMTTNMDVYTAVLATFAPSPSVIYPVSLSILQSTSQESDRHPDPTAPSAVQEPTITSFSHQIQDLDPSFPLCGQSMAPDDMYVKGCTPQIKSTYPEGTMEHVVDILTTYSQDEKHWTSFQSQLLMFDSSGQFFSTRTSDPTVHLSASATTEINHVTAPPQMDISSSLPSLEDSGFSVITYTSLAPNTSALSGSSVSIENSLLIRQTDSSGPITKGHPTQQILGTSLSPFYGMSTTLLSSLQAVGLSSSRRQSTVQPASSSASISSSMNLPPKVLQSVPVLIATVGFPFHYSIPPKTFLDPEDGEADALSLEIRLIDGPPISVGTWLALDGLELHGVPLEVDLQFSPQHLVLAAQDRQGLSTWLPLTLDLRRSPVDPCHIFTLTAQRSLHSILRRRHRVELLLGKLSRFFNSSSNHHLSVVSMRPGSTVVSWYNYSLCGMLHNRVRRCYVDQIRSMWLAMRAADGSVNPAFRESMLPEFPITKVGPVSYRQDCSSTTSTPAFDESTPTTQTTSTPGLGTNTSLGPTSNTCASVSPAITATSQQMNQYQWMAGMFTALLVICLLILIVLLVAVVLYFCKGRGRSRTVAIWPAGRALSIQSRDLRAIRPRRPPLLRPELPPPPLTLWINLSRDDEGRLSSTCDRRGKTIDRTLQPRPPKYDFSDI